MVFSDVPKKMVALLASIALHQIQLPSRQVWGHLSSWSYQQLVSSATPGELCQWWCCAGTTFPMILMLHCSDPALQEPGRKLIQLNFVPESQVCKSLQKSWNWLTCSWQLHDVIGPFLTAGYLSELGAIDKSFLSALFSSMHELLLDMLRSGWCIVFRLFKILQVKSSLRCLKLQLEC